MDNVVVVLLCLRPQVLEVCPYNEVVVFQPQSGISTDLGFVANYTFYSNPPTTPVSTDLWIF